MNAYFTYNQATKRLTRASDPATIDGQMVVHPSAAMYARIGAFTYGNDLKYPIPA